MPVDDILRQQRRFKYNSMLKDMTEMVLNFLYVMKVRCLGMKQHCGQLYKGGGWVTYLVKRTQM